MWKPVSSIKRSTTKRFSDPTRITKQLARARSSFYLCFAVGDYIMVHRTRRRKAQREKMAKNVWQVLMENQGLETSVLPSLAFLECLLSASTPVSTSVLPSGVLFPSSGVLFPSKAITSIAISCSQSSVEVCWKTTSSSPPWFGVCMSGTTSSSAHW